jgi:hypothetical protein
VQKVQKVQQVQQVQQEINHHLELIQSYANIIPRILLVHQQLQNNPVVLKLNNKNGTELLFLLQKYYMQLLASMMVADSNQYLGMLLNIYRDIEKNRKEQNRTEQL